MDRVKRCGECGRAMERVPAFHGNGYAPRWACRRCDAVRPDDRDDDADNRWDDITRSYEDMTGD